MVCGTTVVRVVERDERVKEVVEEDDVVVAASIVVEVESGVVTCDWLVGIGVVVGVGVGVEE